MLLSELSLIEVTTLRTDFRQTDAREGSGEVNFLFGSLNFEVGAKLIADEKHHNYTSQPKSNSS